METLSSQRRSYEIIYQPNVEVSYNHLLRLTFAFVGRYRQLTHHVGITGKTKSPMVRLRLKLCLTDKLRVGAYTTRGFISVALLGGAYRLRRCWSLLVGRQQAGQEGIAGICDLFDLPSP